MCYQPQVNENLEEICILFIEISDIWIHRDMIYFPTASSWFFSFPIEMSAHCLCQIDKRCFLIWKTREVFIICYSSRVSDINEGFPPLTLCTHLIIIVTLSFTIEIGIKLDGSTVPGEAPEVFRDK